MWNPVWFFGGITAKNVEDINEYTKVKITYKINYVYAIEYV